MAVVMAVAAVASTPLAAESAQIERAEAKAIEGKAFFQSGLFDKAAESYMAAFVISRKPDTLFNAARANEEAGKVQEAIALFEMYLKLPDAKDAGKLDARDRIAKLKSRRPNEPATPAAVMAPAATAAVTTPATPAMAAAPQTPAPIAASAVEPAKAPVAGPAVTTASSASASGPSLPLSYGLFAGGTALTVVALASWADAYRQASDAQKMNFGVPDASAVYRKKVSDAEAQRNRSVVFGVVGAGLAGWGAWRLWGPAAKPAAGSWWWAPSLAPDGAQVAVGGRF